MEPEFFFVGFAVETMGSWGTDCEEDDLRHRKTAPSDDREKRSTQFLYQRISLEILKGNTNSIFGTMPSKTNFFEVFFMLKHDTCINGVLMSFYHLSKKPLNGL